MYLVTGATGNVGSQVVAQLLEIGESVRVFTRDPAKVAHWGNRIQVAVGDFEQPETFAQAAVGAKGVFLMNGGPTVESFAALVAAAKAQGNPRMVFLSTILAYDPKFVLGKLHRDKEEVIQKSGLPGKFLRPGGFMSNAFQWIHTIKSEGVVYNALADGKSAPVAPDDIAAVAVKALTDPSLTDEVFDITGGELITVPEQVSILAKALGKPIQCVEVPTEVAVQGLVRLGIPAPIAAAVGQSFEAVRNGDGAVVYDTVERVTGRRPKTFEAWAKENASRFA